MRNVWHVVFSAWEGMKGDEIKLMSCQQSIGGVHGVFWMIEVCWYPVMLGGTQ